MIHLHPIYNIYKKYIQKLLDEKKAFYCWHTKEELEKEKRKQMEKKEAPRHRCAHKRSQNSGYDNKGAIIRLDMPEKKITFNDLIRGLVEFDTALLGDISIAKNFPFSLGSY